MEKTIFDQLNIVCFAYIRITKITFYSLYIDFLLVLKTQKGISTIYRAKHRLLHR